MYIIPIGHRDFAGNINRATALDALRYLCTRKDITLLVYKYQFEGAFLKAAGIDRPLFRDEARTDLSVIDVMIARHLAYPHLDSRGKPTKRIGLKDTARDFLGVDMVDIDDLPGIRSIKMESVGRGKKQKTKLIKGSIDFSGTDPLNPIIQRYQALDVALMFPLMDLFESGYDNRILCLEMGTQAALLKFEPVTC